MAGLSLDLLKLGSKPKTAPSAQTAEDTREGRIEITAAAAAAIKEQMARRTANTPETGLRVGVKAGGCSGLSYVIQFEDHPRPDDKVMEKDGVKVYCDPKSHVFLAGTELDYTRTLMKTGFEFRNPKQKSACGCGESFTI